MSILGDLMGMFGIGGQQSSQGTDSGTQALNDFTSDSLGQSRQMITDIRQNLDNIKTFVELENAANDKMGDLIDRLETDSDTEWGTPGWWPK